MQKHRKQQRAEGKTSSAPRSAQAVHASASPAGFLDDHIARLFRRLGYRVRRRPATHDQGVDLGILATTSTVSRSAQLFADGKPLLLLDGPLLRLLLPDSP